MMAHWLVKEEGYHWRRDCTVDDLHAILRFLLSSDTPKKAGFAPDYPVRVPSSDEDETPDPLAAAGVHEVLVRFAAEELDLRRAVDLVRTAFDEADEQRSERDQDELYEHPFDAWDVLAHARAAVLGEDLHKKLTEALCARRRSVPTQHA